MQHPSSCSVDQHLVHLRLDPSIGFLIVHWPSFQSFFIPLPFLLSFVSRIFSAGHPTFCCHKRIDANDYWLSTIESVRAEWVSIKLCNNILYGIKNGMFISQNMMRYSRFFVFYTGIVDLIVLHIGHITFHYSLHILRNFWKFSFYLSAFPTNFKVLTLNAT